MGATKANSKRRLVVAVFCLMILSSCTAQPAWEKGDFKDSDLVELIKLDPTFKLDIKYATDDNFIGQAVYDEAKAFLQRPAAQALVEVNRELKALGYGLVIFDGYRPWSVTKTFWDLTPKEKKKFVANPKTGSRHNRGCAIDVSLYELSTGKVVDMPSAFDEMNESAYPDYQGGALQQRVMRDLLINKMEAKGFKVYQYEWWHFDFWDWKNYRMQNIQFSDIPADHLRYEKIKAVAREIISTAGPCALITVDKEGRPRVRAMDAFSPEADFTVWFGTNSNSRKVGQIKNDPRVTLYYLDGDATGYVMIHGKAELIDDPRERETRWKTEWEAFYPNNRANYLLIKVTPEWMEVSSTTRGILSDTITWQPPAVKFK